MKQIFALLISTIKPFMGLAGAQAHSAVDRVITIPKADRLKLYGGMPAEDVVHAEDLYAKHVDATSDWLTYVASRGSIEED